MYFDSYITGKRIQQLRKTKGLTQEQFAIKLNISDRHLGKIERGEGHCFHRFVGRSSHFTEHHLRFFDSGRIGHSTGKGVECADQEAESEYPEFQK